MTLHMSGEYCDGRRRSDFVYKRVELGICVDVSFRKA